MKNKLLLGLSFTFLTMGVITLNGCSHAKAKILAFGYTTGGDAAHANFANEANNYFKQHADELGIEFEFAGTDWSKLTYNNLKNYKMVFFYNARPGDREDDPEIFKPQQEAFKQYMENGGGWIGFHSCAFSMVDYQHYKTRYEDPGYWPWYQDEFLACGDYARNTWNPTSEFLKIESRNHPSTKTLENSGFLSSPNEWYDWEYDLTLNKDIEILLTLNPTPENPAGDQPDPEKKHEIWTSGHIPVAWANKKYKMVYVNWGHNLMDYNTGKEGKKSNTFSSKGICEFTANTIKAFAN